MIGSIVSARVCLAIGSAICATVLAGCSAEPVPSADEPDTVDAKVMVAGTDDETDVQSKPVSLENPNCLSYGSTRTSLTSDGPQYPLPVFSPDIERRCVIAFRDNRSDIFTILPAGELPKPSRNPRNSDPVFGMIPNAGGIRGYDDPVADGEITVRAETALGGQANANAMLTQGWDRPAFGKSGPRGLSASWRAISIEGDMTRAQLERGINSLGPLWAKVPPGAKGNDRLDGMNATARWQDLPDGRFNLAEIGAPDLGVQRDKPQQATYVKLEKRGRTVTALAFHLESDNGGCYHGVLNSAGKVTEARFYDPMQWGDEGIVKIDDFWPDSLAPRPMRVGSKRVQALLNSPNSGWDFDICRKAFAGSSTN